MAPIRRPTEASRPPRPSTVVMFAVTLVLLAACGSIDERTIGAPEPLVASTLGGDTATSRLPAPSTTQPSAGDRVTSTTVGVDSSTTTAAPTTTTTTTTTEPTTTTAASPTDDGSDGDGTAGDVGSPPSRPAWLGTRVLATDDAGVVLGPLTTPGELLGRRFPTVDTLPPPADDRFEARIQSVPDDVLARSTWREGCPVSPEDLRYVILTFWGFDDRPHNGELIVHHSAADDVVSVFAALYEARYPIEEMRVVDAPELDAPPTGDGNNTTAFVCRAVTGGSRFSQHAYGLAVDINPFHNPYQKGDVVLPELATAYLDRDLDERAVITAGDVVDRAFADIGWFWGGRWRTLKDYHHFSHNNR